MSTWRVVYGAGGHGRDLAEIIAASFGDTVVFADDNPAASDLDLPHALSATGESNWFIGVADPATRAGLDRPDNYPSLAIHPSVIGRAENTGNGTAIGAGTTLGPGVTLGRHAHIGAGCTITRTTIGDYCQIAPGVDIAGDVTIGDRVFIGVGATIANLVTIGDDVTVGAGAVVLHDVPAGSTVAGVPARVIHHRRAAA